MTRLPSTQLALVVLAVGVLVSTGCVHTQPGAGMGPGLRHGQPAIAVPPPEAVPGELRKVTLPEYVIEPPDVLRIEAVVREPDEKDKRKPTDKLRSLPLQPVWGEYQVRPDGTVFLGVYGSVQVAGYTLKQAAAAIREKLAKQVFADADGLNPDFLLVVLDVTQYNSKWYYVFTDGGGAGETVTRFQITGSETVLDAVSNIGGLSPVSSKRNIWVARRTPHAGQPEQILPVDWVGLSQHGCVATNYQIMPGDRVYIKAQRLVTVDTTLARVIAPIERIFGITLLGTTTINQIQGRGNGFGGN